MSSTASTTSRIGAYTFAPVLIGLLAGLVEVERSLISETTLETFQHRRETGGTLGGRPRTNHAKEPLVLRLYSLDLNMARLSEGAENSIFMAFVEMCAEKIWRLLRLFFITIFAWLCTWQWSVASGSGSVTFGSMKYVKHWLLDSRSCELSTLCALTAIGSTLRDAFQKSLGREVLACCCSSIRLP